MTPPLIPGDDGESELDPGIECLHIRFVIPRELFHPSFQEPLRLIHVIGWAGEVVATSGGQGACTVTGAAGGL
jgi:hypothetical protein